MPEYVYRMWSGSVAIEEIANAMTALRQNQEPVNNSEYTGIPAYLMDFGFGGFLGYGKGVPVGLVNEELKKRGHRRCSSTQRTAQLNI